MSGVSCGRSRSIWPGARVGASARIPSLPPRRPRLSGSISTRRRVRWSLLSTRSRTSRRSNAPRVISSCRTAAPSAAGRTTTSATAPRTLFAAFDVVSGEVMARHYKRRRWVEFLDFMNRIVATHPEREIHVILDNLNTHKPKRGRWLARHKNVHFHFTPTHASWLNQVECWFSILGGLSLNGASFTGITQLRKHIDAFVASYNQTARPFAWSKSEVHQKRLKPRFADL